MAVLNSTEALKATIGRRKGLAKSNKFIVYMNNPVTAGSGFLGGLFDTSDILEGGLSDIFKGKSIEETVRNAARGVFQDPRDIYLLCTSAQLPGRTISATERLANGPKPTKIPFGYENADVSFTFRVTNDMHMRDYFRTWQELIIPRGDIKVRADATSRILR